MKKTLLFLGLASVMLAFTGCVKDVVDAGGASEDKGSAPAVLVASVGGENETRTAMIDGKIVWKSGDELMVFSKNASSANYGVRYTLKSSFDGQKRGEFTPVAGAPSLTKLSYFTEEDSRYVAVYPANKYSVQLATGWWEPTEVGAVIPEHQDYKIGSYDPLAVPMMAVFDKDTDPMKFKFMGAMLRTSITSENFVSISKIVLRALPDQGGVAPAIAGEVRAKFIAIGNNAAADNRDKIFTDLSLPMIDNQHVSMSTFTRQGVSQIVMTDPAPTSAGITLFSDPTQITFGLLPNNYPNGLAIKCILSDGEAVEMKTASGEIVSGQMITLPTFELPFDFGETYYSPEISINTTDILFNESVGTSADVESFDLMIFLGDKEIGSMRLAEDQQKKLSLTAFNNYMETLVGKTIDQGSRAEYDVVLRANFKASYKVMSAAYSIPEYYTYEAGLPILNWEIYSGKNFGEADLIYFVNVNNHSLYTGYTIKYAFLEGKDVTNFSAAKFVEYNSLDLNRAQLPKYGTDYTFAARIMKGTTTVKTYYLNVKSMDEAKAPPLAISLDYKEIRDSWTGNMIWVFAPSGVKEILAWYKDATYECHYKLNPTSASDMAGAIVRKFNKDSYYAANGIMWDDLFYGVSKVPGTYNVQVIMKSSGTNGFGTVDGTIVKELKTNIVQQTL